MTPQAYKRGAMIAPAQCRTSIRTWMMDSNNTLDHFQYLAVIFPAYSIYIFSGRVIIDGPYTTLLVLWAQIFKPVIAHRLSRAGVSYTVNRQL